MTDMHVNEIILDLERATRALVDNMRENESENETESETKSNSKGTKLAESRELAARNMTKTAARTFNERDVSEEGIVMFMDAGNFLLVPVRVMVRIIVRGLEGGGRRTATGGLGAARVAERHRGIVDALPGFARGEWGNNMRVIDEICEWDNVDWAEWWMEQAHVKVDKDCLGYLGIAAAFAGAMRILKNIVRHRSLCKLDALCDSAARGGQMDVVQWLRAEGCPWSRQMCGKAVEGGHLEVLQWVRERGCPWEGEELMSDIAARTGHLEILKWVCSRGYSCGKSVWCAAASNGHVNVLQYLLSLCEQPYFWFEEVCGVAAYEGHLHVIQWACRQMHEGMCPLKDEILCEHAVRGGHLVVLKWLRKNGCPWDTNSPLCGKAAMGGHLDVLQWLREQGFPWDNLVCMYAVEYEHPAVLKWARGAGCPWGKLYVHNVQWSNLDTLNWLGANGCP
jgi:hypothetical protein